LVVVGTGISLGGQITVEAYQAIQSAEFVPYIVADALVAKWIQSLNPAGKDLMGFYAEGKSRLDTYEEVVEAILDGLRARQSVCAAFYGHPGVFAFAPHEAIRRARGEGFEARMLPGVSAEDCLFADLGIDPATTGCQSYEATDFLIRPRRFDPRSLLVLWQIGVIGELSVGSLEPRRSGVELLVDVLFDTYPSDHEVIIYEAAVYPVCAPVIQRVTLGEVVGQPFSTIATLVIPPYGELIDDLERTRILFA
jgi:uncharacterized protein YabN with tetrapyrrole methylase and pyrophosphatase domain